MNIETRDNPASTIERRTVPIKEIRVVKEEGKPTRVVGVAAPFDSPSVEMKTAKGVRFIEKIAPGAFGDSLARSTDKQFLVGHEPGKLIARTSGETLSLGEKSDGLHFDATLPDTTLARDLVADIDHKNIRGMSFGFNVLDDAWEKGADGVAIRTLKKVELGEVSATQYPAYPETSIESRSVNIALERLAAGIDPGTTEQRCGGYYGEDRSDMRSTCQRAMEYCRSTHDAMESALHAISTRKNDPNEHELRAVKDLMGHVRSMTGKARELRSTVKPLALTDAGADDPSDDHIEVQAGGDEDSPRSISDSVMEHAIKLGMPAEVVRSVLPRESRKKRDDDDMETDADKEKAKAAKKDEKEAAAK